MKKGPLFEMVVFIFNFISYYFFWDWIKTMIASAKESFFSLLYLILFLLLVYILVRVLISLSTFLFVVLPSKIISRFGWVKVLSVMLIVLALVWWYNSPFEALTSTPKIPETTCEEKCNDFTNNEYSGGGQKSANATMLDCFCINANNFCEKHVRFDLEDKTENLYIDSCKNRT